MTTRFNVASVEKIFTAVLVFELIEERKLALGGKLCDYLLKEACPITSDQLLTHTSGLPDVVNPRLIRAVDGFKIATPKAWTAVTGSVTIKPSDERLTSAFVGPYHRCGDWTSKPGLGLGPVGASARVFRAAFIRRQPAIYGSKPTKGTSTPLKASS